jgi:hypothetical protein
MTEVQNEKLETYAYDFLCTYKQLDCDNLYRSQLLQAFKLTEWNDKEMTIRTDKLFTKVEEQLKDVFDIFRNNETRFTHLMLFMGEHLTNENLFRILFTMDLFQEAHICFCDILNTGSVKNDNKQQLIAAIMQ